MQKRVAARAAAAASAAAAERAAEQQQKPIPKKKVCTSRQGLHHYSHTLASIGVHEPTTDPGRTLPLNMPAQEMHSTAAGRCVLLT
jgi:hypothetical protein